MSEYHKGKKCADVSVGQSVRILRDFQELSQNQLVDLTGIPQSTLSAVENDHVTLGMERAHGIALSSSDVGFPRLGDGR